MKRFTFFLVAVAPMAGLVALTAPVPGHADEPSPLRSMTRPANSSKRVMASLEKSRNSLQTGLA